MPSDSETLGFVVLESLASGVPVIGARAGGIPDLIDESEDSRTGYLVPPATRTPSGALHLKCPRVRFAPEGDAAASQRACMARRDRGPCKCSHQDRPACERCGLTLMRPGLTRSIWL